MTSLTNKYIVLALYASMKENGYGFILRYAVTLYMVSDWYPVYLNAFDK
jgi:hypothetical protein